MRLALTLVNGDVVEGDAADIQRLLQYTSAYGAAQAGVPITIRSTTAAGLAAKDATSRWLGSDHIVRIDEVV